jgi:hypothetical protein
MQTEEDETPQSVSFFNQPKQADTWGSLHQVSRKREINNIIYTWKANSSPNCTLCLTHMATAQVMSVFVKQKQKKREL